MGWFEIPVSDLDRAKTFYEQIFEIDMEVNDFGKFKMAIFPHKEVGGALVKGEAYTPSADGSLLYLDAGPDLTLVQDRVAAAGGSVVVEKRQISPEYRFMAVIMDSEGNRIVLHSDN